MKAFKNRHLTPARVAKKTRFGQYWLAESKFYQGQQAVFAENIAQSSETETGVHEGTYRFCPVLSIQPSTFPMTSLPADA